MIVIYSDDAFLASFPNIFVDYALGEMQIGNKTWRNWNKAPLRLWQTQLSFAVFYTSNTCGVSSELLNYKNHPMVTALYIGFTSIITRSKFSNSPVAGGGHYHQEREFSGPGDFRQFWGVESKSWRYSVSWVSWVNFQVSSVEVLP